MSDDEQKPTPADAALSAVEKALTLPPPPAPKAPEDQEDPPTFRSDGIDLGPAFDMLIERIQPIRDRLLKSLASTTARNFQQQRDDLLEYQSYVRAFDVLSGHLTPDGQVLAPLPPTAPDRAREEGEAARQVIETSGQRMRHRASLVASVPLEPPLPRPQHHQDYAPPQHRKRGWLR